MATYSSSVLLERLTIAEVKPLSMKILERAVKIAKAPISPKSFGDSSRNVINPMMNAMT